MRRTNNLTALQTDPPDVEYLICQIAMQWRRLLNVSTQHLEIMGTERRALLCISCHPGLTQVAIAELLDIEPQNLMRTLDKLQDRDWIEKKADLNDRRAKCLFVTAKGKKMITQIKSVANQIRPQILSEMNENQLAEFASYLSSIRENLTIKLAERD